MKRALLLLTVLLIGTSVFAAPKPQAVPPSNDSIHPGTISIGNWGGWPVLGYQFSDAIAISGSTYYTNSGGTTYGLLLKADYDQGNIGKVNKAIGLLYSTTSTGASGSWWLTYGLTAMVLPNFSMGVDLGIIGYTSGGGTSSTTVFPGAAFKTSLYL